jgi:hypothetical protein
MCLSSHGGPDNYIPEEGSDRGQSRPAAVGKRRGLGLLRDLDGNGSADGITTAVAEIADRACWAGIAGSSTFPPEPLVAMRDSFVILAPGLLRVTCPRGWLYAHLSG